MRCRTFAPVLLVVGLSGCKADSHPAEDGTALQAGNAMSCVSGAEKFSGNGEQVGVGSLGGDGKQLSLSLQLMVERDHRNHIISTGLMAIPMAEGTSYFPALASEGSSDGSYDIKTADMDLIKAFTGSAYGFAYADEQFDKDAKLRLRVDKFARSVAPQTGLPRFHIAGEFEFNAAYMPYVNGNLPDACSMEAIQRSIKSISGEAPRYPRYDAKICNAEQKHVECTFDVTFDGLPG